LIIISAKGVFNIYKKEKITQENLINAEEELKNINEREIFLNTQIDKIGTENGKEKELKNKYNIVKENEKVIVIVDEKKENENFNLDEKTGFWAWVSDIFR